MTPEEKLLQIKQETIEFSEHISKLVDDWIAENKEIKPDLTAEFVNEGIHVTWTPFESTTSDLWFYAEGLHKEWQHSVNKYVDLHGEPFDTTTGDRLVGKRDDREDYRWYFKLEADGEQWTFELPAKSQHEYKMGFWDVYPKNIDTVSFMSLAKSKETSVDHIVDAGMQAIPFIGGFSQSDSEWDWQKRLRDKAEIIHRYPKDQIEFILLIDEPYHFGWDKQDLETILELAKQEIGDEYKFGYTFMEARSDSEHELPDGMDVCGINMYTSRTEWGVDNKQEFLQRGKTRVEGFKSKTDAELFFVGQAFYTDGKFVKPKPEQVQWHDELMKALKLKWLLWYELNSRGDREFGTDVMPEYLEAIKRL